MAKMDDLIQALVCKAGALHHTVQIVLDPRTARFERALQGAASPLRKSGSVSQLHVGARRTHPSAVGDNIRINRSTARCLPRRMPYGKMIRR
jgi:hypothetical protein